MKTGIPQWRDFSFSFDALKEPIARLLSFLVKVREKKIPEDSTKVSTLEFSKSHNLHGAEEVTEIHSLVNAVKAEIKLQLEKLSYFLQEYTNFTKTRLLEIKLHVELLNDALKISDQKSSDQQVPFAVDTNGSMECSHIISLTCLKELGANPKDLMAHLITYELASIELMKEIRLLLEFVNSNLEHYSDFKVATNGIISQMAHQIQICEVSEVSSIISTLINMIAESSSDALIKDYLQKLEEIGEQCEKLINREFKNCDKIECPSITQREVSVLILLLALCTFMLICFVASNYVFDLVKDYTLDFMHITPIFRGYFLICLMFLGFGIDVYYWKKFSIDYQLCFGNIRSSSNVCQILITGLFFVLVGLTCLTIFILSVETSYLAIIIKNDILPMLCVALLLIYFIFPSSRNLNMLNFKGRIYFIYLMYECLITPLYLLADIGLLMFERFVSKKSLTCLSALIKKVEFRHMWFVGLFCSMIGPLRDIDYTICYAKNYQLDRVDKLEVCNSQRLSVLIIGMIPNTLRMMQCMRRIIVEKSKLQQFFNIIRFGFALTSAGLAFYYPSNKGLLVPWIIIAIISSLYSTYWDLKYCFGLIESDSIGLRRKFAINRAGVYYACIVLNFILRFAWVLSTSPELSKAFFVHSDFIIGISYSLEILRKTIWNYLRVEYEHIKNCKNLKVSNEPDLPLYAKKGNDGSYHLCIASQDNKPACDISLNKENCKLNESIIMIKNVSINETSDDETTDSDKSKVSSLLTMLSDYQENIKLDQDKLEDNHKIDFESRSHRPEELLEKISQFSKTSNTNIMCFNSEEQSSFLTSKHEELKRKLKAILKG